MSTSLPSPPPNQHRNCHKESDHTAHGSCLRLNEAPHMGNIGEECPDRGGSRLLGVHGFGHIDSYVDFTSSNRTVFFRGLSRHQSRVRFSNEYSHGRWEQPPNRPPGKWGKRVYFRVVSCFSERRHIVILASILFYNSRRRRPTYE